MSTRRFDRKEQVDGWGRAWRSLLLVLIVALIVAIAAVPALAQLPEAPPLADTAPPSADTALRTAIEQVYDVAPSADGILLTPRQAHFGVRQAQIVGAQLMINGDAVSEAEARAFMGDAAQPLLDLAALTPDERLALFGWTVEDALAFGEVEAPLAPVDPLELPEPPEPPAVPDAPAPISVRTSGERLVVFEDLRIDADSSVREAVAVLGSVQVDGEVRGDASAILGDVRVDGRVGGEVIAIGGDVYLGPGAIVDRGITSIGGQVHTDSTAHVDGAVTQVPIWGMPRWEHGGGPGFSGLHGPWWNAMSFIWRLLRLALGLLILSAVVLIAPRAVARLSTRIGGEALTAGLIGLLVLFFSVPVLAFMSVLLAISIIGIPVLVLFWMIFPFLLLAVIFVLFPYAIAGVCHQVGGMLLKRRRDASPYAAVIVGLVVLDSPHLLGSMFDLLPGSWFDGLAGIFLTLGWIVRVLVVCVGIGAVILGWVRRRQHATAAAAAVPAVPAPAAVPADQPEPPADEPADEPDDEPSDDEPSGDEPTGTGR